MISPEEKDPHYRKLLFRAGFDPDKQFRIEPERAEDEAQRPQASRDGGSVAPSAVSVSHRAVGEEGAGVSPSSPPVYQKP